ncbi:MAG: hypothetical protein OIF54_03720, partial [Cohaesibacter sp.]|nr:hypothetical protein [Cohaesibacter sp.]
DHKARATQSRKPIKPAFGALKWLTQSVIFLGRASLNCLDNSMQKVRIKKENTPALSVERYLLSKPFQSILWVNLLCRWYNCFFAAYGARL